MEVLKTNVNCESYRNPKVYVSKGSKDSKDDENINRRIAFLTKLYEKAGEKSIQLNTMRQRNMNFAIAIFAGMFTFTIKFSDGLYSIFISLALLCIMIVFCLLDRRFHKFIHGWRKTKSMFRGKITDIINDPIQDVSFQWYWPEGEKTTEIFALQPIIFYFFVFASFVHLCYFIALILIKFIYMILNY